MTWIDDEQKALCARIGVPWVEAASDLTVGIARNVRGDKLVLPVNGLRHPIAGTTTGWYIWAGEELSQDPEFFKPLHVAHLRDWCPLAVRYLGLPPGWRFLTDGNYEDVWEDASLLDV